MRDGAAGECTVLPPYLDPDPPPTDMEGVLARFTSLCQAQAGSRLAVSDVVAAMGEQGFGPLILVPALIGLSPIGAIPGVPAITSAIIFLFAGQILLGFKHFWLPGFLARRSIAADSLARGVERMRPAAKFIDRLIGPRLTFLTDGPALYVLAAICVAIAVATPVIELVPLAGLIPNAAMAAIGLAITARDGVWALLAFAFTAGVVWFIVTQFP